MPSFLMTWLLNPKTWAGLGAAAVLAFAGVQTWRLSNAKHDLAAARAALIDPATRQTWQAEDSADRQNLATARQNLATLNAAVADQNTAVSALHAQSASDTAKAQAAIAALHGATKAAAANAAMVMNTKPGPDGCASADALILNNLRSAAR